MNQQIRLSKHNCWDCNKLTRELFEYKTIIVCARCYAVRVGHPSAREVN